MNTSIAIIIIYQKSQISQPIFCIPERRLTPFINKYNILKVIRNKHYGQMEGF